jgi:hypothetical protein
VLRFVVVAAMCVFFVNGMPWLPIKNSQDGQGEHSVPETKNTCKLSDTAVCNSKYSNHVLNTGHTYGTISHTMEIIKMEKKGKHLNSLEK